MLFFPKKEKETSRPILSVKYDNGSFVTDDGNKVKICEWCGCVHTFFCPRIKQVEFYPSAADKAPSISRIEFWEEPSKELWGAVVELVPHEEEDAQQ